MRKNMVELILSGFIGLFIGIGGTIGVSHLNKKPMDDKTSQTQQEIIKQLTNLDIVEKVCSPEYIQEKGNLLCRELSCLVFSRGIDSQTSGSQCEEISNIQNTISLMEYCRDQKDSDTKSTCYELFWRRK
jgi:hypothetical protein